MSSRKWIKVNIACIFNTWNCLFQILYWIKVNTPGTNLSDILPVFLDLNWRPLFFDRLHFELFHLWAMAIFFFLVLIQFLIFLIDPLFGPFDYLSSDRLRSSGHLLSSTWLLVLLLVNLSLELLAAVSHPSNGSKVYHLQDLKNLLVHLSVLHQNHQCFLQDLKNLRNLYFLVFGHFCHFFQFFVIELIDVLLESIVIEIFRRVVGELNFIMSPVI